MRLAFFLFWMPFFSACASFPDESEKGILWQSSPQIPVWVSHKLETTPNLIWFVGKGISSTSKKVALSRAQSAAFERIWEWFSQRGIRVLPAERQLMESHWNKTVPVSPFTSLSLENCHDAHSPTICDQWLVQRSIHPERREAWVLVSVETAFLKKLEGMFLFEDKKRLRNMILRDHEVTEQLSNGNALSAIRSLEKNQLSTSRFHSQKMMSSLRRQQLEMLSQKTFMELWTIRRSITLSPYRISQKSLIVPVGKRIHIPYDWALFFRMNRKTYFIKGLSLDLFLDPPRHFPDFPFLFLFPPSGFSEKKILWIYQGLFLGGDFASLEKIRKSAWIEKKCAVTNGAGVTHCVLTHILVLRHKGRICVRPVASTQNNLPNVFNGMISCLPVSFYHRRELHGVTLNLKVDQKLSQPFPLKLSGDLQDKGFLINKSGSNELIGSLKVLSVRNERIGGATLYSESLLFTGKFVDQNGVVRWGRKIFSRGFGFTGEEADKDSVNRMIVRIVRSIDRSVRIYHDPINSSFHGRMIPIQNALLGWVSK
jgi:hypothetical protein